MLQNLRIGSDYPWNKLPFQVSSSSPFHYKLPFQKRKISFLWFICIFPLLCPSFPLDYKRIFCLRSVIWLCSWWWMVSCLPPVGRKSNELWVLIIWLVWFCCERLYCCSAVACNNVILQNINGFCWYNLLNLLICGSRLLMCYTYTII